MVNLLSKVAIVGVVLVSILYQFLFKSLIFDVLGFGRHTASIKDFNHIRCEKVDELGLEGCEDMWLHDKTGFLYMACSDTASRVEWLPAIDRLNASGRGLTDRIAILDTRGTGRLASRIKWITPENFPGVNGDATLNLHGLDIRADKHTDMLRILLVNHRPPVDPVTGEYLDATAVGANSTIEQFLTKAGTTTMRHIKTFNHPLIHTPNRVAWVTDASFVLTNDHSGKVGRRRHLDTFLSGGNVVYCNRHNCNIATPSSRFQFPNGLAVGRDGLVYVPNTISPRIDVFSLTENHLLNPVTTISAPFPIDNLSVDKNGDIYAASFPKLHMMIKHQAKPFELTSPSTVVRIRRAGKGYEGKGRQGHLGMEGEKGEYLVEEVLEDDGAIVNGATIAVHDVETGRIFIGGASAPWITVCETRGV